MDANMDTGSEAAAALERGEDTAENQSEGTFFLPQDFPGSEGLKPGDTITLQVVGRDSDGALEVEKADSEEDATEGKSWQDDMRKEMGEE